MDSLEPLLDQYGLIAVFGIMLVKAAGVPIPIPSDLIMLAAAARAAEGKLPLWQAFAAILLALVAGGMVQFVLVRGLGRGPVYRFGSYIGLTPQRLDAAASRVQRGGPMGVGLAILTPGVRAATIVACALAGLSVRTFATGLALGSTLFLSLHFFLGYIGGTLLAWVPGAVSWPWIAGGIAALLSAALAAWLLIRRRQHPHATPGQAAADALRAWEEAACPACLLLGARGAAGVTTPEELRRQALAGPET